MEAGGPQGQMPEEMTPEQEQMLLQMEEEMRKVRVQDMITQSVVSILNLSARRIGKEDERDLEQARVGIDAVNALVGFLEPEAAAQVKNAISELQLMYTQHSGGVPQPGAPPTPEPAQPPKPQGPGLWVPGQ